MKGERRKGRWWVGEGGIRAGPCRLTFFSGSLLLLSPARILYLKASTRIYDSRPSHSTPHTYLLLVPFFFLSHRPYTRSSNRFFARPFTSPSTSPSSLLPSLLLLFGQIQNSLSPRWLVQTFTRGWTRCCYGIHRVGRGQRAWEGREEGKGSG